MSNPDMLSGVTMSAEESAAMLTQIGKTTDARLAGVCKACQQRVELGSPIARSLKFGWSHLTCLDAARREAANAHPG